MCMCLCMNAQCLWRSGQLAGLTLFTSVLPPFHYQGLNSSGQTWQQVPLSAGASWRFRVAYDLWTYTSTYKNQKNKTAGQWCNARIWEIGQKNQEFKPSLGYMWPFVTNTHQPMKAIRCSGSQIVFIYCDVTFKIFFRLPYRNILSSSSELWPFKLKLPVTEKINLGLLKCLDFASTQQNGGVFSLLWMS